MTRPLRIEYPVAVYLISGRGGTARREVYLDNGDREGFLKVLAQVVERFGGLWRSLRHREPEDPVVRARGVGLQNLTMLPEICLAP